MGGAPYLLGVLSGDGYQTFATLPGEYPSEEAAIRAAQSDYLARFGGTPTFRVYQARPAAPGPRLTLIEVSFDETKLRSFVALYKVIEAPRPAAVRRELARPPARAFAPFRQRVAALLARFFPGPTATSPAFSLR
ncbi:hypothetical protein TA3x_004217 [Tundrisphaera sp. TA3]|uniref:hypothetical protein n=1 Tax=Tundrisphaera sp. TA3 TaxID=3435775 RepID=UPI003EB924D9